MFGGPVSSPLKTVTADLALIQLEDDIIPSIDNEIPTCYQKFNNVIKTKFRTIFLKFDQFFGCYLTKILFLTISLINTCGHVDI